MSWEVEIHQIDVGQGESALILAIQRNGTSIQCVRSVLIDGGLGECVTTVLPYLHEQLKIRLKQTGLNTIVVSHYDRDHLNGITALLKSGDPLLENTVIADCGYESSAKTDYLSYVNAIYQFGNRSRITAKVLSSVGKSKVKCINEPTWLIGQELLWRNNVPSSTLVGGAPTPPPTGAPTLSCVGVNKYVQISDTKIKDLTQLEDIDSNNQSISLLLNFNNFQFYTAGDLETDFEDEVLPYITQSGKKRVQAFKAGHHGSKKSTSANFLSSTKANVCLISCGANTYEHPNQFVIDRLQASKYIENFLMTGCPKARKYVADYDENQLWMKARVCGYPAPYSTTSSSTGPSPIRRKLAEGRSGTIVIRVNEKDSLSTGKVPFNTYYYEKDLSPPGLLTLNNGNPFTP